MKPPIQLKRVLVPLLSIFGLVSLSFILGAAVMHFKLPSSNFLRNAFIGGQAWQEKEHPAWTRLPSHLKGKQPGHVSLGRIDRPDRTFDGFTLYTYASITEPNTRAFLINMHGEEVHRWSIPFSRVWPDPPQLKTQVNDKLVSFFGTHLYRNGDLLVVFQGLENSPNGYGLAKLDKDSNVIWKHADNIHHDVDVGPDGTIYAIKHELVKEPPRGLGFLPSPCLVDSLVVLSAEGKPLRKPIPLLETFRDSPYAPLLSALEPPVKDNAERKSAAAEFEEDARRRDPLHTNFVKLLTPEMAPKFPQFKAGQLLISMRDLDAIAMIDLDRETVVWAARGPWKGQHDPQFLDNGNLLLFDNLGSPRTSRVFEYDPKTQAFPWSYPGEKGPPFVCYERGMSQRLPNGNTLIVHSVGGEILEVTPEKEVVWTFSCPGFVLTARRYSAERLTFLSSPQRPRP